MTADQLEMISRVPARVTLDCLAAGMTAEEITTEYPAVTVAGVRAAAAYSATGMS